MKKLIVEKIARIIPIKAKLSKELDVEIKNMGKEVYIEGDPEKEHLAEQVIDAIDMGFPINEALLLKEEEEFMMEIINIKDYSKKDNLERVRGRIIGRDGKTLRVLSDLTGCFYELKNNKVAIIGETDKIKAAQRGIISLIQGSKQANVYSYLEKHQPEPVLDLGIKDSFKKKLKSGVTEDSQEDLDEDLEEDEEEN